MQVKPCITLTGWMVHPAEPAAIVWRWMSKRIINGPTCPVSMLTHTSVTLVKDNTLHIFQEISSILMRFFVDKDGFNHLCCCVTFVALLINNQISPL